MVYLGPTTPPVLCDRCGGACDADLVDVSGLGERPGSRWLWGRITCRTSGCVDEHGSTSVEPPDEPGRLTREDRRWVRRHIALADEFARESKALLDATAGW